MEFFKPVFLIIGIISLMLLIYGLFISRKEKQNYFLSKTMYFPLGFLTIALLTPALAFLLTMNVSKFEGGRGYAYIYSLPLIFFVLIISWVIIHRVFKNKSKFYLISTSIFAVLSTILISIFSFTYFKDKKEQIEYQRNSHSCKQQFEDGYSGIVIETVYGSIKIRKLDSTYNEFRYRFGDKKMMKQYFYKGQKIGKHPNYEKFEVLLKNGTVKEFLIPCYR